ncbi:hypothetical protein V5F34_08455 [Xanthobacter autotrophicus]|uniref:hypothetical protein n=1 Tax=Xanthobacter autotrophicus TaxID=280 RepID=UPI003728814D
MSTTVIKPFTTKLQRFPVGVPVTEADDLAPFTLDDLKERGFVGDPPAPEETAPEAAPAPRAPKASRSA